MQTFNGLDYVKISIANAYGLDKLTWDERIEWVDNQTPPQLASKVALAAEPMIFTKALYAYDEAARGVPTGYIMSLDATASGLQIMACLMGCVDTAKAVNLVNTGTREDIYDKVAKRMDALCDAHIDRGLVKYPLMTTFYGSIEQPKSVFGEDTEELKAFYKALQELLPGALEVMEDIQGCWQGDALVHSWTLPDGHTAYVPVMATVDKKIEVDELANATFTHRMQVNQAQEVGISLAANVVHS